MDNHYRDSRQHENGYVRQQKPEHQQSGHSQYRGANEGSHQYNNGHNYQSQGHSFHNNQYQPPEYHQHGAHPSDNAPLVPFQKDFYVEHENVRNRSDKDNLQYMATRFIKASGKGCPRPVQTFEESGLPQYLKDQLQKNTNFTGPTSIQSQSWPVSLQGRDLIGIAQTGSGKTLAFVMPAIVHVMAQPTIKRGDGPIVLVMAPTRELCMQIEQEAKKYASVCQLTTQAIYGGVPKYQQSQALRNGVEILIACPGRLLDFLDSKQTNLRRVTYLVLDEADRMLDMGFEKDIKKILDYMKQPDRQTLMFSATWPKEIQSLANQYCSLAPIHVAIGDNSGYDGLTVNPDIKQVTHVVNGYDKKAYFLDLLIKLIQASPKAIKIIVFCQMKKGVDELDRFLHYDRNLHQTISFDTRAIHGDKDQYTRDAIYAKFKAPLAPDTATSSVLIATDVASRGLDVKDIDVVVNYDMPPGGLDNYVHRIGRTGRAGAKGVAHSFVTKLDLNIVPDLVRFLKKTDQEVSLDLMDLKKMAYDTQKNNHKAKARPGLGKISFGGNPQSTSLDGPGDAYKRPAYGYGNGGMPAQHGHPMQGHYPSSSYAREDVQRSNFPTQPRQQNNYYNNQMSSGPSHSRDYNEGADRAYENKRDRKYDDRPTNLHSGPGNGYSQKDFKAELFGSSEPASRGDRNEGRIFIDPPPKEATPVEPVPMAPPPMDPGIPGVITPAIIKFNSNPIKIKPYTKIGQISKQLSELEPMNMGEYEQAKNGAISSTAANPEDRQEQGPSEAIGVPEPTNAGEDGGDNSQRKMMWGPQK